MFWNIALQKQELKCETLRISQCTDLVSFLFILFFVLYGISFNSLKLILALNSKRPSKTNHCKLSQSSEIIGNTATLPPGISIISLDPVSFLTFFLSWLSQHYEDIRRIWTSYEYIFWHLSKVTCLEGGVTMRKMYITIVFQMTCTFYCYPSQNHINDKDSKFIEIISYCIIVFSKSSYERSSN